MQYGNVIKQELTFLFEELSAHHLLVGNSWMYLQNVFDKYQLYVVII